MAYKVIITPDARKDLENYLSYLVNVKKNPQAATNVNNDFEDSVTDLENTAGSLKLDDDPDIATMGYHRIHLKKHRYFLLYIIENNTVFVDRMFHDLQDYKNLV